MLYNQRILAVGKASVLQSFLYCFMSQDLTNCSQYRYNPKKKGNINFFVIMSNVKNTNFRLSEHFSSSRDQTLYRLCPLGGNHTPPLNNNNHVSLREQPQFWSLWSPKSLWSPSKGHSCLIIIFIYHH